MRKQKLPSTDSIKEWAKFWDTHDVTDFEEDLEETPEPVFVRGLRATLTIELPPAEAQNLKQIARSKGVRETAVLRQWTLERLREFSRTRRPPDNSSQPAARKTRHGQRAGR